MGATLWHFVENPSGLMVRLPRVHAQRFLRGEGALEAHGRGELRFVDVLLAVDRRVVRELLGTWPVRRRVRPDGPLDAEHAADATRSALASADLLGFLHDDGDNVERIEPHLARRHVATVHRWVPSSAQLQQILNAVHAAAADPPIAVVTADGRLAPI